jgi:hypothetical protein
MRERKTAVEPKRTPTAYSLILLSVAAFFRTSSLATTRLPLFPRPEIDFSKLANQYAYGELPALFSMLTVSRAPVMRFQCFRDTVGQESKEFGHKLSGRQAR